MIVSVFYFGLFFGIFFLVIILQALNQPKPAPPANQEPFISVLVAVRNEEHTIIRCLEAFARQNYPAQKIEVLIGDDASTDNTFTVIQDYIRQKPFYRCIRIQKQMGQARGKGNVLAHLTRLATTNYFFITDADIQVPENWIRNMLGGLAGKNIGIVTGVTTISGQTWFHKLQAIDWINAIGLMQVVSDLNLPVSTMGNNMLITRAAYEATGGYESLPFSVTEDVQLFKEVIKKGIGFKNLFHGGVLALSTPAPNWGALLHQRKRWMQGIRFLPWYMTLMLVVYASFYAFCLPFIAYVPVSLVAAIFMGKLTLQTWFIYRCIKRLTVKYSLITILLFEIYALFLSMATILFFLLPFKFRWKERKY
jgi:cellulose synthase/poly-beta-1,6-N-acetylglucosamine synthase-like glycosyltransferase